MPTDFSVSCGKWRIDYATTELNTVSPLQTSALVTPAYSSQSAGGFIGNDPNSVGFRYPDNLWEDTPRLLSELQKAPELVH